jgi:radical SAM protein with 4Fe4S-binding SPASM domain
MMEEMDMCDDNECHFQIQTCVWEITTACCFSCKYCGSMAGMPKNDELTTEECIDVAEQLAGMGCRRVSLIGGEVFMRSDWADIAKVLTVRNVKVSIITNGYLFSKELISKLKEIQIESVAISLDGPENIHDQFRQKGSFHRAVHAIDVLSQNNIPVSVISTLHSLNVPYLDDLFHVLQEKNIFAWQLQACSPMGNAAHGAFSTNIDFHEVINFVEKHIEKAPFIVGIADDIGYYSKSEGYLRGNTNGKAVFTGCRAGLTAIGIDSVGNVRGCESMYDSSFIEGNLRERCLYDIWTDPDAFSYNRRFNINQLSGNCRGCKHGNRCAGGCRSYNFFTHGALYDSPYCVYSQTKVK